VQEGMYDSVSGLRIKVYYENLASSSFPSSASYWKDGKYVNTFLQDSII